MNNEKIEPGEMPKQHPPNALFMQLTITPIEDDGEDCEKNVEDDDPN